MMAADERSHFAMLANKNTYMPKAGQD